MYGLWRFWLHNPDHVDVQYGGMKLRIKNITCHWLSKGVVHGDYPDSNDHVSITCTVSETLSSSALPCILKTICRHPVDLLISDALHFQTFLINSQGYYSDASNLDKLLVLTTTYPLAALGWGCAPSWA
ncbi:hypothetical protein J1614_002624 [Plenodomus biglobosus]|nr:hypothetical protein J1614_002624 [Plenodomus biglobosus]